MWVKLVRELGRYDSAVLTGLDAAGYPYSVRCQPDPDAASQTLRVRLAAETPLQPGPASLLCHRHDEVLWNQRSFLARGRLVRQGDAWMFQPTQLVPGIGVEGVKGLVRFVITARRNARRYLAARHLPRPRIPWADINAAKAAARARRAGGQ
ncbi:MAG TPA: hypothetical protein VK066_19505 [Chloroflexota bacterium]|nr:hypothetical protein [Chloroflexota bacterium]